MEVESCTNYVWSVARIHSDVATAATEDVERGEGGLLDPLPVVVQRPALLCHGVPDVLHLRLDLAVSTLDLAVVGHRGTEQQRQNQAHRAHWFWRGLIGKPGITVQLHRCDRCSPAHLEHVLETALHLLRHVCATQKQFKHALVGSTNNNAQVPAILLGLQANSGVHGRTISSNSVVRVHRI